MQDPFENIQDKERAAELIAKHLQGALSDEEKQELDAWIDVDEWHRAYFQRSLDPAWLDQLMAGYHRAADMESDLRAAVMHGINLPAYQSQPGQVVPQKAKLITWRTRTSVAAAVILLLGIGIYFWYGRSTTSPLAETKQTPAVVPGRQGAILTLADGRLVTLDSLPNGVVAVQNGSRAAVVDGQLAYHPESPVTSTITYNTITTPRGRQYQLVLSDGTRVWLNAASRITFPTAFNEKERKVSIDGEAYFEVARNTAKPFKVNAGSTDVEVLGTSFNINAYKDAYDIRTTLLDGSIKVYGANANRVLKPGQQALTDQQLKVESDVNTEQVIAWKNGLFYFNRTGIATVMQQLSRWYDIDVRYEGGVPDIRISGKMDKGLNLNEIMEFLTKMEVKCRLLGRTVVVSNN